MFHTIISLDSYYLTGLYNSILLFYYNWLIVLIIHNCGSDDVMILAYDSYYESLVLHI